MTDGDALVEALRAAAGEVKPLLVLLERRDAELTRWRAWFSTPEVAEQAFKELRAGLACAEREINTASDRIEALEEAIEEARDHLVIGHPALIALERVMEAEDAAKTL